MLYSLYSHAYALSDLLHFQLKIVDDCFTARDDDKIYMLHWRDQLLLNIDEFEFQSLIGMLNSASGIDVLKLFGAATDTQLRELDRIFCKGWITLTIEVVEKGTIEIIPRRSPSDFSEFRDDVVPSVNRLATFGLSEGGWEVSLPHAWADLHISSDAMLSHLMDRSLKYLYSILLWVGLYDENADHSSLDYEMWTSYELLFHERTRRFGRDKDFGGNFWAASRFAPPSFEGQSVSLTGNEVVLPRADFSSKKYAKNFVDCILSRRSSRRYSSSAIPLESISDMLALTSRVLANHVEKDFEYVQKTYPSGGSAYELDIYMIVTNVEGVEPGLWRYFAKEHCMRQVEIADEAALQGIIRSGMHSIGASTIPPIMVLLVADFARIMWKYRKMGYSIILKNTGSFMANTYLVCNALGLGCCAIGSGDSDLFAKATLTNPMGYSTVGEIAIGFSE